MNQAVVTVLVVLGMVGPVGFAILLVKWLEAPKSAKGDGNDDDDSSVFSSYVEDLDSHALFPEHILGSDPVPADFWFKIQAKDLKGKQIGSRLYHLGMAPVNGDVFVMDLMDFVGRNLSTDSLIDGCGTILDRNMKAVAYYSRGYEWHNLDVELSHLKPWVSSELLFQETTLDRYAKARASFVDEINSFDKEAE